MVHVGLVNINRVKVPPIGPYAIDILATVLNDAGHEVSVHDFTFDDDFKTYFLKNKPDIIGVTLRNTSDLYFPSFFDIKNQGSFIPEHKMLVSEIKKYISIDNIIIGGVGYSSYPYELLDELGLKIGVRGPGENVLVDLANKYQKDGFVSKNKVVYDKRASNNVRKIKRNFFDNKKYYALGGLGNIRTSNGCGMHCGYCVEPYAKGKGFAKNSAEFVLEEIDQLVNLGIKDIHTVDSEFNLPFNHSKKVLRGIISRKYPSDVRFWAYCQPKPFDSEYADLLSAANFKGVNFGTDHTQDNMLKKLGKWYSKKDIVQTTALCKERGIKVMHELLFGYPGETKDSIFRAIDFVLKLDPEVTGITVGIGVLPGTGIYSYYKNNEKDSGFFKGTVKDISNPDLQSLFYVDSSIKVPDIFEDIKNFVGSDIYRVMVPELRSTASENNQLIDSVRIKKQLDSGMKGAYWYNYRKYYE